MTIFCVCLRNLICDMLIRLCKCECVCVCLSKVYTINFVHTKTNLWMRSRIYDIRNYACVGLPYRNLVKVAGTFTHSRALSI